MKRFWICVLLVLLLTGCDRAPAPMTQCETAYAALREADSLHYWSNAPEARWFDGQTVMIAGEDRMVASLDGRQCWKYLYVDGQYLSCLHVGERLAWKSSVPQRENAPEPAWTAYPWDRLEMQLVSTASDEDTVTHSLTSGFLGTQWQFTFLDGRLTALEVTREGVTTRYEFQDSADIGARIRQEYAYYTAAFVEEPPADTTP